MLSKRRDRRVLTAVERAALLERSEGLAARIRLEEAAGDEERAAEVLELASLAASEKELRRRVSEACLYLRTDRPVASWAIGILEGRR